jgi:hypothetical protein
LEWKARRLLWEYGSGETPQAQAPRRLAETPTESEVPGAEINSNVNRAENFKKKGLDFQKGGYVKNKYS